MRRLTHIEADGRARMVDVSAKPISKRRAVATGKIRLRRETLDLIKNDRIAKGNVFATARIAGIQAAKQTAQLIPLCHTLPLGEVKIDIVISNESADVKCTAQTVAQTGVEMEALVGPAGLRINFDDWWHRNRTPRCHPGSDPWDYARRAARLRRSDAGGIHEDHGQLNSLAQFSSHC